MGQEVTNAMRGQCEHGLRVSNIKIRKYCPGAAGVHVLEFFQNGVCMG